jgi:hypothetical protein
LPRRQRGEDLYYYGLAKPLGLLHLFSPSCINYSSRTLGLYLQAFQAIGVPLYFDIFLYFFVVLRSDDCLKQTADSAAFSPFADRSGMTGTGRFQPSHSNENNHHKQRQERQESTRNRTFSC